MKGTITKRSKGVYLLRLSMGKDRHGKRLRPTKTVHGTRKEAERALRDWVGQYEAGRLTEGDMMPLSDYLEEWLRIACRPRVSAETLESYRAGLERYVDPTIGRIPIGKITPMDIQRVYSDLRSRGLSAGTVKRLHAPLSQAFRQAVRWRKIPFNPMIEVDLPRSKRTKKRARPMTLDQALAFLDAAALTNWSCLFQVALASGMRPGEFLGLTWPCVQAGAVRVERSAKWPRGEGRPYLGPPKTKASRRTIPLPPKVMRGLGELDRSPSGLVFPDSQGKIWTYSNFVRVFRRIMRAASLEGFAPYDLRHTCATLLLLVNTPPKIVSERLGHSTIAQTMDTYTHVLPTMQQGASDQLGIMLFGDAGDQEGIMDLEEIGEHPLFTRD